MSDYRLTAEEKRVALERARNLREKLTGPVVPPGGEELREAAVKAWLEDWALHSEVTESDRALAGEYADTFLALNAVRDALAAQEKLRRVEELAEWNARMGSRYKAGGTEIANDLRAALDGDS